MVATDVISSLPPGYEAIFRRAREALDGDQRVRAMWLGGSLARGTADAASDLDVIVAVRDEVHEEFATSWPTWLAKITPTVLAQELPFAKGSFFSVTPGFERFDLVVESVSQTAHSFFRERAVVFDRDGLDQLVPRPEPGPGPNPATVEGLVEEYFRVSAVETIIERDDWLLAREHLHLVASLVYRLFVEANAPLPPMGVKQWSTKLTAAQRDALSSLPTDARDLAQLRAGHLACAEVFVPNAEALYDRLGLGWPVDLEVAARDHLRRHLGVDEPYPRRLRAVV